MDCSGAKGMKTAFCFDVDGTLTTTEILPCIAADLEISEEIAALTRATMDGLIPFEDSFRLRVAILGQVPISRIQSIVSSVPLNKRILKFIQDRPEQCFLITGNLDKWIEPIITKAGCRAFSSSSSIKEEKIRVNNVLNKGVAISQVIESGEFSKVVAVGDGANDCTMLEASDIPVAFGGVHPPTREVVLRSRYVVNDGDALCRLLSTL